MSTLVTQNLQDTGGTVPVATVRRGSAKAWAHVDGSAAVVRASLNVSSLTDDTTGRGRINFTSAFLNSNEMCFSGGVRNSSASAVPTVCNADLTTAFSTTVVAYVVSNVSGGSTNFTDLTYLCPALWGTIA